MKNIDLSLPPCGIVELGKKIEEIGNALGVECKLSPIGMGYAMPTLSEDLVRIGNQLGLKLQVVNGLIELQSQLGKVLDHLKH